MRQVQQLRERIARGETVVGTFLVEFRAAGVPPILREAGFDFIILDTEHGYYAADDVLRLIQACRDCGLCAIVRVSGPHHDEITRMLDAGAEGIMIPMVRDLETVREAVNQSKYPPLGRRGAHFLRPATGFHVPADATPLMEQANRELITAVQIETVEAAAKVEEIAAIDGVDMLYVGPGDLSISMGLGCVTDHPKVMAVADRVVTACAKHGKIAGGHFGAPAQVAERTAKGMHFLGYAAALRLLIRGAAEHIEDVRGALQRGKSCHE